VEEDSMTLRHFNEAEFNNFAAMDKDFLRFLDEVRHLSDVPFHLTSDYRSAEHNARVGGHPSSLHVTGSAVDFVTPGCQTRNKQVYYRELWQIAWGLMQANRNGWAHERSIQFEIVKGPNDWHIHLGLWPDGDSRKSKLIVATD
jgi:hypothetical protein